MKYINKSLLNSLIVGSLVVATSAVNAQENKVSKDPKQVTENTPDKVLLEGKKTEKMFEVLEPSETLTLTIEDIQHDIKVTQENGMTVLHVKDANYEEVELIRKTYAIITNSDSFKIKTSWSDEYSDEAEMQTSGTVKEMNMKTVETGF